MANEKIQQIIAFLNEKIHHFRSWKNNHYVFLGLSILFFGVSFWLENALLKMPVIVIAFFCAGQFIKEFENKK
jgi:hypothetical protein